MFKKENKKNIYKLIFMIFCFGFGFFSLININVVKAVKTGPPQNAITTYAPSTDAAVDAGAAGDRKDSAWSKWWNETGLPGIKEAGSEALGSTLRNALNTIAYDTATWLGSGGKGQGPLFIREGWGEYLNNILDNAAGYFIEEIDKEFKLNLCEPSLGVKLQISLGLVQHTRPKALDCTYSKMKDNWDEELSRGDFLSRFQNMFEPTSSDLGIALTLHTKMTEKQATLLDEGTKTRNETGGWLNNKTIAGYIDAPPGDPKSRLDQVRRIMATNINPGGDNDFVNATNIFLNQLAITAFNNLISQIGKDKETYTSPYSGDYGGLGDYDASSGSAGIAGTQEQFRQLLEPNFTVRGDYNILAELTTCPDPTKAGPTNCVITDNFSQAVINKMTVGEAMNQGYLNPNGIFGFTADGLEPSYNEGYPYRSMIILRKFRIIPVGWEVASQNIKQDTDIGGTKNLEDLVNCFDENDDYDGYSASWCEGLVDPTWVLKAPLNYCKREGPGPEIVSEQIIGAGDDSELAISRNDSYCADEQSCIKENDDGSCELYGYCTEERRKWTFDGSSCEPKYNTCQTFRSSDGQTISYLENSIDYGDCTIDNVGCQWYCTDYNYANGDWQCTVDSVDDKIYFDKDVEECDADAEGCHEFIRTKAGIGANLIPDSSFENDNDGDGIGDGWTEYPADFVVTELIDDSVYGNNSQRIVSGQTENGGGNYGGIQRLSPINQVVGEYYTISFYAKRGAGNNPIIFANQAGGIGTCLSTSVTPTTGWQRFSKTCVLDTAGTTMYFYSRFPDEEFFIDGIKLERGTGTSYSDYREDGLVYQKLAPDYLGCDGNNDPAECDNFVRECFSNEEGCEMYTSVNSGMEIPAKVIPEDYCPAECAGYNTYIQKETSFDSLRASYFIPSTADSCSSVETGCDEFTNLDEVAQGGEGLEYYTNLRQCIGSQDPGANCSEFYTWEGSDESGFQLRVFQLNKDDVSGEPAVTQEDSAECDATIYNKPSTDPAYNSDCREFYDTSGNISYHLYTRTITCSDNCYPYRRTENNIDENLISESVCSESGSGYLNVVDEQFNWDSTLSVCYFCKNGGTWNSGQGACIYNAIPGEGQACSSAAAGCREYAGNTGNNTAVILNNDFEGGTQGWAGTNGTIADNESESLTAGEESLEVSGGDYSAAISVGSLVNKGRSYVLRFWAKSDSGSVTLSASFNNDSDNTPFFGEPNLNSNNWNLYTINLTDLDHEILADESLVIKGDGNFYIDDIVLTEIIDNYFLIKNSWNTPNSCGFNIYGDPVSLLNLGCDEYKDRDNNTHYLYNFSVPCSPSSVGCEFLIDTYNYSDYNSNIWNENVPLDDICDPVTEPDCVLIPTDGYKYIVYDREKTCNQGDKGCQYLGSSYEYSGSTIYNGIYLKNNPDNYNSILCTSDKVGCAEWTTSEGTTYFKDPGEQTCEWRQAKGVASGSWGWYKQKIKKCDINGDGDITSGENAICLNDNDCELDVSCILDENDEICSTRADKSFGIGGKGNEVLQPTNDNDGFWAGLCPAAEAGCSEYIDPLSKFSINILFNSDFSQDVDGNDIADGWSAGVDGAQDIELESSALYILSVDGTNTVTIESLSGSSPANKLIDYDYQFNKLGGPVSSLTVSSVGQRESRLFYTDNNIQDYNIEITAEDASTNNSSVELKKVIVDYQIKQEINKTTCNGIVNFEDGCVLFNERSQNGEDKIPLIWDANLTYNDGKGATPQSGSTNNSNTILKVNPDRVCNKWLACRSIVEVEDSQGREQNVCFDVGLCDSVDDNGDCDNFLIENQTEQEINISSNKYINNTGYSKVGWQDIGENSMKGDFPLGVMDQDGEVVNLPNGGFEFFGSNGYPTGWRYEGGSWNEGVFKVINNPVAAQIEGIGYAREGRGFLKMGSTYSATSEPVDVVGGIDYLITAYINTINLSDGEALIKIEQFNIGGTSIFSFDELIKYGSGNDWDFQLGSFQTASQAAKIKITLYSSSDTVGNYYFDDIKIKPALNSRTGWYTPQSCRLYAEDDSMSCEYFDDSGIKKKGWWGYCLEHDRYPGSTDACLLWWPVDKIKGDGIEEGAGYTGRIPAYYCLETNRVISTTGTAREYQGRYRFEEGSRSGWPADTCDGCVICRSACTSCPSSLSSYGISDSTELPAGPSWIRNTFVDLVDWNYDQDGGDSADYVYCELEIINDVYCTKVVQTVSSAGQNKYWSGRTYEGSDYSIPCNLGMLNTTVDFTDCLYPTENSPFGSMNPPVPTNNPYEWDSDSDTAGNQPIRYNYIDSPYADGSTMGQEHDKENIENLFAQSYGVWEWDTDSSTYIATTSEDWGPPTTICTEPIREESVTPYCAYTPTVDNIEINSSLDDVSVSNNGFINLTFTSDVDDQQQPMVLYAVEWGDNEDTVVTGVEMHDKPDPLNPHVLYHLYSYWDLKAKNSVYQGEDENNIYCGDNGEEAINYNESGSGYICPSSDCCIVKPKIQIKDNWGWCNGGRTIGDCDEWESFGNWIIVTER